MATRGAEFINGNTRRAVGTAVCCLVLAGGLIGAGRPALAQSDPNAPCDPVAAAPGASCMDDLTTCSVNCTANDVLLTVYNVFGTCDGGTQVGQTCVAGNSTTCELGGGTCIPDVLSCIDGEMVTLNLQAEVISNAAERWDIGIFIALDGGDALTGDCAHNYLNSTPLEPGTTGSCTPSCSTSGGACFKDADCPAGETCDFGYDPNSGAGPFYDGECAEDAVDSCGDLEQGVPTFLNLLPITILCQDADGNGFLDLGTATSWDNGKSDGSGSKPSCLGEDDTLPNTPSKCRAEPVQVGTIEFRLSASIEVCKDVVPNADPGLFDLEVNGAVELVDAGDGACTGKVTVSAGTTGSPGDTHTVGESAGTGTSLSTYNSTITCVDRGLTTFNSGPALTFTGSGPLNVAVDPDDDIVCTITNTEKCEGFDCSHLNDDCNVGVCAIVGGAAVCQIQAANEGGSCDDGDPCTVSDVCTGGTCGGSPKDCSSADDQCNVGVCNAGTGVCEPQPANEGGACDDGLFCTVGEVCAGGACGGGSPRDCDDAIACTSDACDEALNQCVHTSNDNLCDDTNACTDDACVVGVGCVFTNDDSNPCSDGLFCNGLETCLGGACQPGTDPCVDGVACTTDSCDEATDSCTYMPVNAACDDGLYCNGVETCDAINNCQAGTPVDCSGLDDQCNVGVCNDTIDACEAQASNEGGACVDGLYCNVGEVCIGGTCGGGSPRDCDDAVGCTIDSCDDNTDQCVHTPVDSVCDDLLYCTGTEVCDLLNDCQPGTGDPCLPPTKCEETLDTCVICSSDAQCDDGSFCNGAETCVANVCEAGTPPCGDDGVGCTDDSCDDDLNVCVHQPNDGLCDNGLWCDGAETCDAIADCQSGIAPNCDDGVFCTVDACDDVNDMCTHTADDSFCDNGLYCDGAETCDPILDCQLGTPIDCTHLDNQCNVGVCDDGLDACVHQAAFEGVACDDGQFCSVGEVCVNGICNNSTPLDCGDAIDCTIDSCDETDDICVHTTQDTLCDDSVGCTTDICDAALGCVLTPVDAACDDSVACTDDTCDAVNDCQFTPNDANCDDGDPCTIDWCDATGGCMHDPVDCSGFDDQCHTGTCNPISGICEAVPSNEGGACDDGDPCTVLDACVGGACAGVDKDCSGLTDQCNIGVCNAVTGVCEAQPTNEGGACDDSDACNQGESCQLGDCSGGTAPDCSGAGDQCNTASCDAAGVEGNCDTLTPVTDGTTCDDDNACNTGETCQAGACGGGTAPDCSGAGDQCNTASCDAAGLEGNCDTLTPVTDGTTCDDDNACNTGETCQAGACGGGTAPDCSGAGDQCNTASCDAAGVEGNCDTLTPVTDGTTCDDDNACNTGETCQAGACGGGTAPDCSGAGDQCNTASCDPAGAEGNCNTITPVTDGTSCIDGDACTTNDTCTGGTCGGTPVVCSDDGIFCNGVPVCDPEIGGCVSPGSPCSGGDVCCEDDDSCTLEGCDEVIIPTVSQWGILVLTLLLLTIGKVFFGRRREDLSTGGL